MKKIILILSLCLFSYAVMAQLPVNFGIHGGLNSTKLKLDHSNFKSSAANGFMIGAFARLNLGPIYVEPSLNYSQKKSEVANSKLKYNSFDIPVMLGLHVLDLSLVKVRAFFGPMASFTGKIKYTNFDLDNDKTMWSGKVGVGVDVWKATFDVDYEKGFKKFGAGAKSPSVFNFTLGFKII